VYSRNMMERQWLQVFWMEDKETSDGVGTFVAEKWVDSVVMSKGIVKD